MPDDPRLHLERLPSETLFSVARNTAAAHRLLAIEILVERASPFAGREEIAAEARQFVLSNPLVLKKIDPASAAFAPQLPGIVDCIANGLTKHVELTRVVGEHNSIHTEKHTTLEATVTDNKTAADLAVREAVANLWEYFARQTWQLTQDNCEQKIDFDKQLAELREEHEKDLTAAAARLTLLERSTWQKFVDYLKSVKRSWIDGRKLPLTDPPANPPLST
jgi:hypothetical protein